MARPSRQDQAAPSADAANTRPTRSTRSQSHEPEQPTAAGKRRGGRRAKYNEGDLATVAEDGVDQEQLQAQALAAEAASAELDDRRISRASVHTDMSGTTAKTSFSQEEVAELDRDVMVDALPNLAVASDELTKFVLPNGAKTNPVVWKETRTAGSRQSKLFNNRSIAFDTQKSNFGSQDYIHPEHVLRALLGVASMSEVTPGPWRPDNLIYKVNLAVMLRSLLIICDPDQLGQEGYTALEQLDAHFPNAIAGPQFDLATFQMCVEVNTQLAIARLDVSHQTPQFQASDMIDETFFETDLEGLNMYKYFYQLHLDTAGGHSDDHQMFAFQRAQDLKEPFQDSLTPAAAIGALRSKFSWDAFVSSLLTFYGQRKVWLDNHVKSAGGITKIVANLGEEVQRRELLQEANVKRQGLGSTPKKAVGASAIAMLKARKRMSGTPRSSAPVAQMTQDDWMPQDVDHEHAQQTAVNTLERLSGFQDFQRQNAQKGRHGEQQSVYAPESSGPGPYHVTSNKRSRADMEDDVEEFDPTQDEGFQTDMRDTSNADERRRKAPRPMAGNARRSMQAQSSAQGLVEYALPPSSENDRRNPGAFIPEALPPRGPDDGEIPRESFYAAAKIQARHNNVMATQNKPPQVRTPWSNEEENALIELIEEYAGEGISYSSLKSVDKNRNDPVLIKRSAEDMRFKARNMKVTMLLAGAGLPTNWEHVILDKKGKDKLASRGIPYYQAQIRVTGRENE